MLQTTKHFYEFDRFRIDVSEGLLLRDGETVPLTQKAFEVLLALVERRGQIVRKEELMQQVWPDSFVEEGNLTQNIYTLRKVLGQTIDGETYIQTVPRRGYRFTATVSESWDEGEKATAHARAKSEEIAEGAEETGDQAKDEMAGSEVNARVTEPALASRVPDARGNDLISRIRQHKIASLVLMIILLLTAAGMAFYISIGRSQFETSGQDLSRNMTVKALTTTGNIACAAISRDGSYVAYATNDNPQLSSLWIEQLATSTRRTIIAPAEVRYHALTFSPDGTYIYYVAMTKEAPARTLYRISVLGGHAKKLIENVQTAISFSPDGAQFTFRRALDTRRESGLFIADADGRNEKEVAAVRYPTAFHDPAWSLDGKVIACAAGNTLGTANMYVVGVNTADWTMTQISAQRWQWIGQMGWDDGSSSLVMVAKEHWASPIQVWRLSSPGGEARKVTNDSNSYNRLSVAADSNVMAALQSKQVSNVWVIPASDTGRAKQITFGAGGYRGYVSWMPDGRVVCDSETGSADSISIMDADGSNQRQLTGDFAGGAYVGGATVSRDGRYIAFASDLAGERHIWRMNIDGSNPVQLTRGAGEDNPQFSPDGRWVLFTILERSGADRPRLGRVSIDGGEIEQLTDGFTGYPTVSPDGKMIASLHAEGPGSYPWKMAIYPFEGGPPTKIFPQSVSAQTIQWTPDGRGLTYRDNPLGGPSKIWIQPIDGAQPKLLAEFETDRIFGFDWSRDGKYIACVRGLWTTNIVLIRDFK